MNSSPQMEYNSEFEFSFMTIPHLFCHCSSSPFPLLHFVCEACNHKQFFSYMTETLKTH